jgi:putative ABC transport system ATP-binding protein
MENKAIVTLENVSKVYQMGEVEIQALKEVNLEVKAGEFIVILGPSGSGKTTLLNLVGGIDSPSQGKIFIDGVDISGFNEKQLTRYRRNSIGFIFQFFNLIPTLSARENVEFALELVHKERTVRRTADDLLAIVGLKERTDHFPYQLSGGEQQRIAIARALAKDPPLLLCDEPTGELDFRTGKKVLKVMRDLNKEEEKTFIVVTHNAVVGKIADRVIHLRDGEIVREELIDKPLDPEEIEW